MIHFVVVLEYVVETHVGSALCSIWEMRNAAFNCQVVSPRWGSLKTHAGKIAVSVTYPTRCVNAIGMPHSLRSGFTMLHVRRPMREVQKVKFCETTLWGKQHSVIGCFKTLVLFWKHTHGRLSVTFVTQCNMLNSQKPQRAECNIDLPTGFTQSVTVEYKSAWKYTLSVIPSTLWDNTVENPSFL